MCFGEKATAISEPHLLRVLEEQVIAGLSVSIGLGDYIYTRVANFWAEEE